MKKVTAVAYARFSSDRQQESSIVVQIAEIKRCCENHKIELIHEYIDEAQTGTNFNRKSFQQMVKDAPQKTFDFIIVHRMDRWARNVDDSRYYKKYFARYGIKIISALEEFDETPEGEFFELMSLGMAELYSKKLARESIAGKIANAKECKAHGGVPLLGYKVQGKKYVIDENDAEIVKKVFELTLKGYGYVRIQRYLKDNGYKRSDGKEITAHFYDVLRNRKYIGEYVYNKAFGKDFDGKRNSRKTRAVSEIIRIPNGLPRIIDDVTFFKVQELMDDRKRCSKGIDTDRTTLLSGLIRCKSCGRAVCGGITKSKNKRIYKYRCNYMERTCKAKAIPCDYLDEYIDRLFECCLFSQKNLEDLISLVKISYMKVFDNMQTEVIEIDAKIKDCQERLRLNQVKVEQDNMKAMRKYIEEHNVELRWEIEDLKHKKLLLDEKIKSYPQFKRMVIIRRVKEYINRLREKDKNLVRATLYEIIHVIEMDNNTVETTINLHKLLNGFEPIRITIIEKRDNIGIFKNHYLQNFEFNNMEVRV